MLTNTRKRNLLLEEDVKLDFDDVLLVPKASSVDSRSMVTLVTTLHGATKSIVGVPIIAANMDGVGTFSMNTELSKFQVFTAITKTTPVSQWRKYIEETTEALRASDKENPYRYNPLDYLCVSIGMGTEELQTLEAVDLMLYDHGSVMAPLKIVMDVANGHLHKFTNYVKQIRDKFPHAFIMAGNVVTPDAVQRLILAGADLVKVGIGSGAACTTRRVTGVGYPQFSAVVECAEVAHGLNRGIISDGGCVHPGDMAKAFGAGASMVMSGSMFAGHYESEQTAFVDSNNQQVVWFYGMGSHVAQTNQNKTETYRTSEGRCVKIPYKGYVQNTITHILGGIRSSCAYLGAKNIEELHQKANFVRVNNTINRSLEKFDK